MNPALAAWNGLEVDMLSLGNADCILVTRWADGVPTRVLIDGGNKCNAPTVTTFLLNRGIRYLDHIVCTHPHDDHVGGLIELVSDARFDFGQFWMHLPWKHLNMDTLHEALANTSARRVAKIINESLESSQNLANKVWNRKELIYQPFAGYEVGFLTVCGPTKSFYTTLLSDFSDLEHLEQFEKNLKAHEDKLLMESYLDILGKASEDGELGAEPTEPENDSSVILGAKFGNDVFLFTGDAGVPALTQAASTYSELKSCRWMQIPHHGSRRNLNHELIRFFEPTVAFVSAAGDKKHPRKKLVNAFTEVGTTVYSTHYPDEAALWYHVGTVPPRADYGPATSLYN